MKLQYKICLRCKWNSDVGCILHQDEPTTENWCATKDAYIPRNKEPSESPAEDFEEDINELPFEDWDDILQKSAYEAGYKKAKKDLKMLARALDVCFEMYELEIGVIVDEDTIKAHEYAKNILKEARKNQ